MTVIGCLMGMALMLSMAPYLHAHITTTSPVRNTTLGVELIDPAILIEQFVQVFKVKGNPVIVNKGAPVAFAEDRLRVLLHGGTVGAVNLQVVRDMPQPELVRLLFRAVAGVYATDPHARCSLVTDPATGALESILDDASENQGALIGMCVTLLCVLGVVLLRRKDPLLGA